MNITFWLNGVKRQAEVRPDELLLDFLRKNMLHHYYGVACLLKHSEHIN